MVEDFFIRELGVVKNDPLLDIEQIIQWFFRDLPYTLPELTELIKIWREIKDQLSIIKQLAEEREIVVSQRNFRAEDLKNMRLIKTS